MSQEHLMQGAEMDMLRYMSGTSRKSRIRIDYIRGSLRVEDMRESPYPTTVGWPGHVMRRGEEDLVRSI